MSNGTKEQHNGHSVIVVLLTAILILAGLPLYAESPVNQTWQPPDYSKIPGFDPNKPASSNLNDYGSMAKGIAGGIMDKEGTAPVLSTNTNSMDRSDNLGQASGQANAGSIVATATGSAMMARGVPMSLSPEPITAAAGRSLMAMGAAELAQGIASMAGSNANNDRKDTLKRTENDTGVQIPSLANPPTFDTSKVLSPEAEKMLRDKNLDPADFVEKAINGEFSDPNALQKFMGEPPLDAEGLAKVKDLTAGEFADINSKTELQSLKLDESNKQTITPEGKSNPFGSSSAQAGGLPSQNARGVATEGASASGGAGVPNIAGTTAKSSIVPPSVPLDSNSWNSVLGQFGVPAGLAPWEKRALVEGKLQGIGVELPSRGRNIFEKAAARYQKYRVWRKEANVAAR